MKITSKLITSAFVALTFATVPACDEKKEDKKAEKKAEDKKPEDKKPEAKADEGGDKPADGGEPAAEGGEPADGGDEGEPAAEGGDAAPAEIGVKECDDYFKHYSACIDKMPDEASRAATKKGLTDAFEGYRRAAETPAGKEGLVAACTAAAEATKAACP